MNRPEFMDESRQLTGEELVERETWMMTDANWREDHSVPSAGEHYRYMWKWDSAKAITINARRGDYERAATELRTLLGSVDGRHGFTPNKVFATEPTKTWRDYPEAWYFTRADIGSSYSQPPLEAWSAMETFRAYERAGRREDGLVFLDAIYGVSDATYSGLRGNYAYFTEQRSNSNHDLLIGITHPNETGRDSDEANKPWLASGHMPPLVEWLKMQKMGYDLGKLAKDSAPNRVDWDPSATRAKYWVNDVMFNCIYASNLRYMSDIAILLGETHTDTPDIEGRYLQDASDYNRLAHEVENEILDRMWDSEAGYFYNLNRDGRKIPIESITGLFPLLLDGISESQVVALLDKLEDPRWFNTPYPIPTHPRISKFYDPDPKGLKNKLTPQWSGPVWLDMNHLLAEEGLVKQAERFPGIRARLLGRAAIIAEKSHELLAIESTSKEYYSPETGRGMRVSDFMWSNLGLHFEKTYQVNALGD